jgi:hypothetical protein
MSRGRKTLEDFVLEKIRLGFDENKILSSAVYSGYPDELGIDETKRDIKEIVERLPGLWADPKHYVRCDCSRH